MQKIISIICVLTLAACAGGPPLKDSRWGQVKNPSLGSAESIGSYNAGCLAGAEALPSEGTGFKVMRSSRNRFYGHPTLIHFIEELGKRAAGKGTNLSIGDLAQPRGGPMSSGHASHQTGLDADIWFWNTPRHLARTQRETMPAASLIRFNGALKEKAWQPFYRYILQEAAEAPETERIFVHASIKKKLCQIAPGEPWLQKIRPWRKHDDHFHVRLRCPSGDACNNQPPVAEGDGCDEIDQWLRQTYAETEDKPALPATPVTLPVACEAVLTEEKH